MLDQTNPSPLSEFVEAAKRQGAGDEFLAALLLRQGWSADEVYGTLGNYWESATGFAVPRRGPAAESAREAFLYLLSFLALAVWASALGTVLFQLVNVWVPDAVRMGYVASVRSTITWSMAAMAVAFPVYLLVTRTLARDCETNPDRLQTGVRKWLTYLALLVTAGTVLGDLIGITGYFLLGELSTRFMLKSLIVLIICGAIFMYYMNSVPGGVKRWKRFGRAQQRWFAWGSMAAVTGTFVAGMAVAGKPADQRRLHADQQRVEDLRQIAHSVEQWRSSARAAAKATAETDTRDPGLPASLEDLETQQHRRQVVDPETKEQYRYEALTPTTYRLCATFDTATPAAQPMHINHGRFWDHPEGAHCYVLDAQKPVSW